MACLACLMFSRTTTIWSLDAFKRFKPPLLVLVGVSVSPTVPCLNSAGKFLGQFAGTRYRFVMSSSKSMKLREEIQKIALWFSRYRSWWLPWAQKAIQAHDDAEQKLNKKLMYLRKLERCLAKLTGLRQALEFDTNSNKRSEEQSQNRPWTTLVNMWINQPWLITGLRWAWWRTCSVYRVGRLHRVEYSTLISLRSLRHR